MASVFLTTICRPVSRAFRSLTPSYRQGRTIEFLSRVSRHQKLSSARLNEHTLYSTSSRRSYDTYSLRSSLPWLPGFSVGDHLGIRNIGHIVRGESTCVRLPIRRPVSLSAHHLAKKEELVTIHFINRDGEKMTVKTRTGQNLLDIVVDNDLDIDGYGACEGTLSCSTCHLIFSEDLFKILPKPSDEELDMLDLAYGQTDMSRLGCQVILTKEMDGMTVVVPEGVADARDV